VGRGTGSGPSLDGPRQGYWRLVMSIVQGEEEAVTLYITPASSSLPYVKDWCSPQLLLTPAFNLTGITTLTLIFTQHTDDIMPPFPSKHHCPKCQKSTKSMSRAGPCKKHQWTCAAGHKEWVQLKIEPCERCGTEYEEGVNCNQCDLRVR
jgi:hypothetical protein